MEDREPPWLVFRVECDFCFGPEWELLYYRVRTPRPKSKLDIWTHDDFENLYTINPTIRKEMVICRDCRNIMDTKKLIMDEEYNHEYSCIISHQGESEIDHETFGEYTARAYLGGKCQVWCASMTNSIEDSYQKHQKELNDNGITYYKSRFCFFGKHSAEKKQCFHDKYTQDELDDIIMGTPIRITVEDLQIIDKLLE